MSDLVYEATSLQGVLKIYPTTDFLDHRGRYLEIYNKLAFESSGINHLFVQDDVSLSRQNVLRGLHGDFETWKLVTCLYGSLYLIVVNNIETSVEFKKWESFIISENNRFQVLIPPGFGNGHLILSETGLFHYKQTTYYGRINQFTIKWNDPNYNFSWPCSHPILSKRDSS